MNLSRSLTSDARYFIVLVQGGWNGVIAARKTTDVPAFTPVLTSAVRAPAILGAAFGVWSTSLTRSRRSRYRTAKGGSVGSALGFVCGAAWASRGFTGVVARSAVQRINVVRDARWIEKNPIDYA